MNERGRVECERFSDTDGGARGLCTNSNQGERGETGPKITRCELFSRCQIQFHTEKPWKKTFEPIYSSND